VAPPVLPPCSAPRILREINPTASRPALAAATSALDSATEANIMSSLNELAQVGRWRRLPS
jgi:hypothetical protein